MVETNIIEELIQGMSEKFETSERKLCALLDEVDAEQMLIIMVTQLLVRPVDTDGGDKFGTHPALTEILAYYSFPRFCSSKGRDLTPMDTANCQDLLEDLLASRRFVGFGENKNSLLLSPSDLVQMQAEIVRGHAYPEQTAGKIAQLQGRFDKWFEKEISISPRRAIDIIFCVVNHLEDTSNKIIPELRKHSKNFAEEWSDDDKTVQVILDNEAVTVECKSKEDAMMFGFFYEYNKLIPEIIPIDLKDLDLLPPVSEAEEIGLKGLIGLSANSFNRIGSREDIRRFPLYELQGGRVLLSDLSNTLDFLWEAFENVAKSNTNFYDRRYQKHKSKWVESKTVEYLCRIFPEGTVFQTLDYPDNTKQGGSTAELDVAVMYEPFLILVEVKAKQFRLDSQHGDSAKLRSDLKANIEDAYVQSLRAINYINDTDRAVFIERSSGNELIINKDEITKIYPMSLSLHRLATVATQLDKTQELGLFLDGSYPFSTCLSDLDLISRVCVSPEVFLHYIERRLTVLNEIEDYHGDELDLFAAYLDSRLHRKNFSLPEEQMNMITFTGYSSVFDRLMMFDRGEAAEKPNIKLRVPDEINNLLMQLKQRRDQGARFISFALLDLDNSLLEAIAQSIIELGQQVIPNGIFRRISFGDDKIVVSVVTANVSSRNELSGKTKYRTLVEKYRRKFNKSIGLGFVCSRGGMVILDSAHYVEYEWEDDYDMEKLIEDEAPFMPSPDVRLPGVNQPCICGSGKKFKKCCKRKIEDSRMKYPFS